MATAACETEMVAVPFFPSDVAVIVAEPVLTAVIMPFASTVATAALLVLHVMARPLSGFCAASYAVAESCACTPGAASTCGGVTTTLATGVFSTVIVAIPDLPFTLAATCVDPSATPVTTPVLEIVAMLGFCDGPEDVRRRDRPPAGILDERLKRNLRAHRDGGRRRRDRHGPDVDRRHDVPRDDARRHGRRRDPSRDASYPRGQQTQPVTAPDVAQTPRSGIDQLETRLSRPRGRDFCSKLSPSPKDLPTAR